MTNVTKLQPPYDPFDIENLRLDQAFASTAGVKKLLTTVPVRKPHRQELVRVHPDEAYRVQAAVIELRDDREIYLVVGPVARDDARDPVHDHYSAGCRAALAGEASGRRR